MCSARLRSPSSHIVVDGSILRVFHAIAVKTLKTLKLCGIIILASSVHDERPRTRTKLPACIVFHVTLTSVDSNRCDSHFWLDFSKICLSHPSTTASLMFCRFAKFLPKRKTCGRTRQRPAMTDFHRKVNKFRQRFPKCDPYLTLTMPLSA